MRCIDHLIGYVDKKEQVAVIVIGQGAWPDLDIGRTSAVDRTTTKATKVRDDSSNLVLSRRIAGQVAGVRPVNANDWQFFGKPQLNQFVRKNRCKLGPALSETPRNASHPRAPNNCKCP